MRPESAPAAPSANVLLLHILRHPELAVELSASQWDKLLPAARRLWMLGRLQPQLQRLGVWQQVPAPVRPHLEAAALMTREHQRRVRWEVNRIQRALCDVPPPIVLLKGAAYVMAELPCAEGRHASDVDILVPRERLQQVESALRAASWVALIDNEYDQQYYRRWAHELPPMRHVLRGTTIDVHHTIVPLTSRLRPDPVALLSAARPVAPGGLHVLAPADMVLHSAVHAFHDGDMHLALRDLLDMHELLSHFGRSGKMTGEVGGDSVFWQSLPARAFELGLQRPLYYAVRFCREHFATEVPASALEALSEAAPPLPVRALMDRLAHRVLFAGQPDTTAHRLLYLRSHWLRMPPFLLTRHLLYKGYRRWIAETPAQDVNNG